MKFDEFLSLIQGQKAMGRIGTIGEYLARTGWKHAVLECIRVAEEQEGSLELNARLRQLLP